MRTGNFLLLSFAAAAALEAAPIYTVTDLGSVGTGIVSSLSNAGVAVGYNQSGSGRQAFSSGGSLAQAGTESIASQTNNFGQVAGTSWRNGSAEVTLWSNGMIGLLGLNGSAESYGNAVNDFGWIAGGATDAQGNMTAFLLEQGTVHRLGTLNGGTWSAANSVNRNGEVAGTSEVNGGAFHAFVWSADAGLSDLGTLGGISSYGAAINQRGTVVGNSFTRSGAAHAFSHDGSTMTDLGTLGGASSYATAINAAGDIVGYSDVSPTNADAFLYRNGVMVNLNRLLAADAGWRLLEAHAINDNGQIAGIGEFNGQRRAFRLDPIAQANLDAVFAPVVAKSSFLTTSFAVTPGESTPEPGTLTMLACGLLLGGIGLWRR